MKNNSQFFENTGCEYYPCHKDIDHINCLFCFCPLYFLDNCPGKYKIIEHGGKAIKSCIDCDYPHRAENYDKVMRIIKANMK